MTITNLPVPERLGDLLGTSDLGLLVVNDEIKTLGEWASEVLENGASIDDLEEARHQYLDLIGGNVQGFERKSGLTQQLDVFFRAGLGYQETARYLCRPVWEVVEYAHTFEVDIFGVLAAEALLREGALSFEEIAKQAGVHRETVHTIAKRFGYESVYKTGSPVKKRVLELAAEGLRPSAIVRALAAEFPADKVPTRNAVELRLRRQKSAASETVTA